MKIWLINQYNMPPEFGHLNRHFNFGKYLERMGHKPSVFVGSFLHNSKIQMIKNESIIKKYENSDYPFYFIKTCDYSSSKLKRIYAMFEFYKNLFKSVKSFDSPDIILGSSAHPLAALAAIRLAKKYECKSIVEVRDLWPESLVAYGILKKNNPLLRFLYAGEKWIYKKADKLIFTMEGGTKYIIDKGWDFEQGGPINIDKVHHLNNGVDLEVFMFNKENYLFMDQDLDNSFNFNVVYTGSIRLVNHIKSIVDVAYEVQKCGYAYIKFLIYGEGDDKKILEQYCNDNGIDNVIFKGYIDKKFIPNVLSKSDLNYVHFNQNRIKRYGASLNKLFEYFASGKPTFSDCRFGYDLIEKYNCGFVMDSDNPEEIAKEIIKISDITTKEYKELCNNSLKAANDYSFEKLTVELVHILDGGNNL